jgi:hypothetical protein
MGAASDLTYSPCLKSVLDLATHPSLLTQQLKMFDQSCWSKGDVVGVDCLLLEPAIRKIMKNIKNVNKKLPWVVHAHTLDSVCEGMLSPTLTTAHRTTNQHLGNFGKGGHP